MKKIIFVILFCLPVLCNAQQRKYGTYYDQRETLFQSLSRSNNDIIFLGNSITDGGEWCELFNNVNVKNRGISGDITEGVYDRLSTIISGNPAKIFLLIGVNDVAKGKSADSIASGIEKIIIKIKQDSPKTKVYVQSILPVNDKFNMFTGHTLRGDIVKKCNELIKTITEKHNVMYIDLFSNFADNEGKLKTEYTNDGLHLLGNAYLVWRDILLPYVKE